MKVDQDMECSSIPKLAYLERETRKRRKRSVKQEYIKMRVSQLKIERDNPHNSTIDSEWYNRIIQELEWAQQVLLEDEQPSNCFMYKEQK
jgi:hypothetical protein